MTIQLALKKERKVYVYFLLGSKVPLIILILYLIYYKPFDSKLF